MADHHRIDRQHGSLAMAGVATLPRLASGGVSSDAARSCAKLLAWRLKRRRRRPAGVIAGVGDR